MFHNLARRRRCLAVLTASLAVLRWNPVAVSWLTDGSSKQRCCYFKRRRERFLLFPSPLVFCFFSFSSFVVKWFLPLYSLFIFFSNSLLCFKLPHILSFLSLFCFLSFYSLRPLFLFRPLFVLALGGIYRAKGAGPPLLPSYCCA